MDITVNGNQITGYGRTAANLEEVLVLLSRHAIPKDHLISSVMVNGKHYTELYPGQSREIPVYKIQELNVNTVSLTHIAEASLKDAPVFIRQIIEHCRVTAECFRLYDETEANQKYAELLEALRSLMHFIDNVRKALGWDFKTKEFQGKPLAEQWSKFMTLIDELKNVQEEGDWILLADVIEYEMIPLLEDWATVFSENSAVRSASL